jgi:hypothetical protein
MRDDDVCRDLAILDTKWPAMKRRLEERLKF